VTKHPLNLTLRFLLEVGAIASMGIWGFHISEKVPGILFAILLPLGFALLWGIFAVKDDPSRSGKTVVSTPGAIRLLLELTLFATATWMLHDLDYSPAWWIFGSITLIHYILSYDRVLWLLKQK
jgi:hypothetical protein